MRHFLLVLISLFCGSELNALPSPIQILGPVQQVPPQCADPTYACQDLENARHCGVVKSCINDIWATMSAPEDNEDICALCKEMVKEARDQLLSNMTQEELKEVFEGSCKLLPVKLIADACIKLVDEFIPQLVEMLASRMDPNMVCTVSGMCNMAHLPIEEHFQNLLRMAALNVGSSQCDKCIDIMNNVKSLVSQMSEADFKKLCINICTTIPVEKVLCEGVVDMYGSEMYQLITSKNSTDLCTSAKLCPTSNQVVKIPLEHKDVGDDLVCQFCTNFLEHIKEMIIANTTVEEFRTALKNFCKHLGNFQTKCTALVDDYYDMLFDYIRKLNTKGVCTLVGLCQSGLNNRRTTPLVKIIPAKTLRKHPKTFRLIQSVPVKTRPDVQPLVKLVPAKSLSKKYLSKEAAIETNEIFGSASESQLPMARLGVPLLTVNRDLDCPFCKAISFFLKKDLENDRSRDGVKEAMDNVCNKWVEEFPDQCSSFLLNYSDDVENHLVGNSDIDDMCVHIKACQLENDNTGVDVRVIAPATTTAAPGGEICDLCKEVCNEAENLVKNPDFQNYLKKFVEQGCQIWPEKQKCIDAVDQNVDRLLSFIEKNIQGAVACPALHLCPGGTQAHISPIKNIECDVCKDVIQQLQNELQDPKTKASVKSTLEKVCDYFPQEERAECKTFIDKNIDAIIQIIVTYLNPDLVCSELNICPDSINPPINNEIECELCKELLGMLENKLKDQKTQEKIKEMLKRVCNFIHDNSTANKCKSYVDEYAGIVFLLLVQEINPNMMCAALSMCSETKQIIKPPENNDMECDICKDVIQQVINKLKDRKTEDALRDALTKVCTYLPSTFKNECEVLVANYTETLITLLMEEMDAASICAVLKMCPESKQIIKPPENNDMECDLCKNVVQQVIDKLKDQKTEDDVRDALQKVCTYLPSAMVPKCKTLVDNYTEILITLLMEEMDAASICAYIKMCPESENVQLPRDDETCDLCKEIVEFVENELKDKRTQDDIRAALEKVCSILPYVATQCDTFVKTYTELFMSIMLQEMDPTLVCATIKKCPTQDLECETCQYLFHFIQEQLASNDTQGELKNVLKSLCDRLPGTFGKNCDAFVDEYSSALFMLVAQMLDPSVVCPELKMCPSQKNVTVPVLQTNMQSLHMNACRICETVVDGMDKLLEDDNVDKEVTDLVKKVCVVFPDSVKDKCSATVETYGPYILQMIGQIADSKQVCQDVDLCSRPPGHVHLLGGNKCTFGPSYWCQSNAHAAACKAETYCNRKVWKN